MPAGGGPGSCRLSRSRSKSLYPVNASDTILSVSVKAKLMRPVK